MKYLTFYWRSNRDSGYRNVVLKSVLNSAAMPLSDKA